MCQCAGEQQGWRGVWLGDCEEGGWRVRGVYGETEHIARKLFVCVSVEVRKVWEVKRATGDQLLGGPVSLPRQGQQEKLDEPAECR